MMIESVTVVLIITSITILSYKLLWISNIKSYQILIYNKKHMKQKSQNIKKLFLTGDSDAGVESFDPRSAAACLYMQLYVTNIMEWN